MPSKGQCTPLALRFWMKVNKTETCWLWTGGRKTNGYGAFWVAPGKLRTAHRVAWELTTGNVPDGVELDHLCRVRHCVNPEHLQPVIHQENVLRGMGPTALHAKKTHCPKGHEYAGRNLIERGHGRECRACRNEYKRRRRAR